MTRAWIYVRLSITDIPRSIRLSGLARPRSSPQLVERVGRAGRRANATMRRASAHGTLHGPVPRILAELYTTLNAAYDHVVIEGTSRSLDLSTAFQVLILWAHAMAAIAWVGGSLFYVAAINPAVEQVGKTPDRLALLGAISREFREVVRVAIVVFVATGAVLVFSRLSFTRLSPTYVVVLAVKIVLSLWMFWLAGRLGPRVGEAAVSWLSKLPFAGWLRPQYVILLLGIVIVALSYVLRALYEQALGSAL